MWKNAVSTARDETRFFENELFSTILRVLTPSTTAIHQLNAPNYINQKQKQKQKQIPVTVAYIRARELTN